MNIILRPFPQQMKKCFWVVLLSISAAAGAIAQPNKIVMGYWTNWDAYHDYPMPGSKKIVNGKLKKADNPDLSAQFNNINALAYAFLEVDDKGFVHFTDTWADLPKLNVVKGPALYYLCHALATRRICVSSNGQKQTGLGNFTAFKKAPVKYKLISIGGYGKDKTFENAFKYRDSTFLFSLKSLQAYALITGVNLGVDLDYEPQSVEQIHKNAKNFLQLVRAVHALDVTHSLTVIAASADPQKIRAFTKGDANYWKKMAKAVDYIDIMGYDLHGEFDYRSGGINKTDAQSNLYSMKNDPYPQQYSVDAAVKLYEKLGVPANKIIVGIPAYAHGYGNVSSKNNGLFQDFSSVPKGDLDPTGCSTVPGQPASCGGFFSYKDVMKNLLSSEFVEHVNYSGGAANAAYAYSASKKEFLSYDNLSVIYEKANYVINHGLGGMMMWELSDDLSPTENGALLPAIWQRLNSR